MEPEKHEWGMWAWWTLVGYVFVMMALAYPLIALGIMPPTDQNNEQTAIAWMGLPVWFAVSWLTEYFGGWKRVLAFVNCVFEFIGAVIKGILPALRPAYDALLKSRTGAPYAASADDAFYLSLTMLNDALGRGKGAA